jgi:hypothetical protein
LGHFINVCSSKILPLGPPPKGEIEFSLNKKILFKKKMFVLVRVLLSSEEAFCLPLWRGVKG